MKSILLCCALSPLVLSAQISLTEADFAGGDESLIMSIATDNTIDFATTGANYSWDFTHLTPQTQRFRGFMGMAGLPMFINAVYVATVLPQYQATYYLPSTDLPLDQASGFLPISITDINQYTRKTSSAITSVGYSINIEGTSLPVKSDTIETRYELPLNFGDTYFSRGYTNLDMNPFFDAVFRQYRQRYSQVDGWGSVATPYGTFDVLRLKHTINEIDSIRIDVFGNQTWIPIPVPDTYIYEWLANGERDAVMRITTNDIAGNEVVTGIEYKDYDYGLGLNELTSQMEIYPNPATDVLSVKNVAPNSTYKIVDMKGTEVMSGTLSAPITSIDVATLQNGMYQLVVGYGYQFSHKTFIKQD